MSTAATTTTAISQSTPKPDRARVRARDRARARAELEPVWQLVELAVAKRLDVNTHTGACRAFVRFFNSWAAEQRISWRTAAGLPGCRSGWPANCLDSMRRAKLTNCAISHWKSIICYAPFIALYNSNNNKNVAPTQEVPALVSVSQLVSVSIAVYLCVCEYRCSSFQQRSRSQSRSQICVLFVSYLWLELCRRLSEICFSLIMHLLSWAPSVDDK